MELRHIRYFLAVAEERNFTRAAARLGIGQPPLSQQIKDLEAELGFALFRRLPHGAELTAAGHAFAEQARLTVASAERAAKAAQRAGRGEQGRLRLGFTPSSAYNPMVTRAVRDFGQAYPDVAVELSEANTATLLGLMHEDVIDAAFLRPGPEDRHTPDFVLVDDEPLLAVLPRTHPCATLAEVPLADLAGDRLILFPREAGPMLYGLVIQSCRDAGFEPRLGQQAPQIGSVVNFVAAGFGVSVVPASIRQIAVDGVVYRHLAGPRVHAPLCCAWRRSERGAVVRNFVRVVRRSLTG